MSGSFTNAGLFTQIKTNRYLNTSPLKSIIMVALDLLLKINSNELSNG